MALQRDTKYPGRYNTGDAAHPQGAFKNRTTPTSQDGSYLEEQWLNDWDGFFASLLDNAGLTPDGNVDAVGSSQYFSALQDLVSRGDYVTAGGTANVITLTHTTPITSYKDGQVFRFKASAANTGPTTINVDGLGAVTLYGSAGLACQGGETTADGYCVAVYTSTLSACVLLYCTGGSVQVSTGVKSNHAAKLGDFGASVGANGYVKIPCINTDGSKKTLVIQTGTYTVTTAATTTLSGTYENSQLITLPITVSLLSSVVVTPRDVSTTQVERAWYSGTTNSGFQGWVACSAPSTPVTASFIAIGYI